MLSRQLQALAASWLLGSGLTLGAEDKAQTPFSEYVLTPRSRTLIPPAVYKANGSVSNANALTSHGPPGTATLMGNSSITFDFGKNVAGIVSFSTPQVNGTSEVVGVTYSESNLYISSEGSDLTGISPGTYDRPLLWEVASGSSYRADKSHDRGAFRYLSVFHRGAGSVGLANVTVHFTAVPQVPESDLGRHYTGYFHSNSEKLNRVWYAGAYTVELCTIDATRGNSLVFIDTGKVNNDWWNNDTITNGSTALVDGAKRDRIVWPGDMTIELPTIFVSTYFTDTIKYSLDSLFVMQEANGALPYSGQPIWQESGYPFSFTYHLHGLISIWRHHVWTGDTAYLMKNWPIFKLGLAYSLTFVDSSGMANVTTVYDWLRNWMGGHNIEANALLYYVLNLGIKLASIVDDKSEVAVWTTRAEAIKTAANAKLWDGSAKLYRDNDTAPLTSLHPQDGNVWAILANLTTSDAHKLAISKALQARWTAYGPPAPEAGPTVSTYISGLELQAHYEAGAYTAAVTLMENMWADFLLDDPRMTNSTFIEGYKTDGSVTYPAYQADLRVSFAHGWASGPTSALTNYAAGLQVVEAGGLVWLVSPRLGGLTDVQAGFKTTVGAFSVAISAPQGPASMHMNFSTPLGTKGSVSVERPTNGGSVMITGPTATTTSPIPAGLGRFQVDGLVGGEYQVSVSPH